MELRQSSPLALRLVQNIRTGVGLVGVQASALRTLTTAEAADLLRRQPATLQRWGREGGGPLQPVRVNGRLLWREADVRRLLQVASV